MATHSNDDEMKENKNVCTFFPKENESNEEKNHPLKGYKDISVQLDEIRKLYIDGVLFDAYDKSEALKAFISEKYPQLLDEYESHPMRLLILSKLKETNRMLNFLNSDMHWEIFSEKNGWKTEWQPMDESDYESFRISGTANVPLYNILAVVYEMDLIKTWMPLCKESIELGQSSLHSKCGLIRIGLFWPIQDRETVMNGFGVEDLKNNRILIYFDSNNKNKSIQIPKCPNNRVRVDVFLGGFLFERLSENETKISCVWNCDPKMNVPTKITNWFAGTFAASLISCIVEAAKFDENSEYAKRIEDNPKFYGRIKDKLAEHNKSMSNLLNSQENIKN